MRNHLHDSNPGDDLDTAMKASEQKHGSEPLQIFGGHGNAQDGTTAITNEGEMSLEEALQRQGRLPVLHDAGEAARAKVMTRGQKVKRAVVRTYILIITCAVLLAAGAVGYVYYEFTKPGKRMVDFRTCQFVDEKMGIEITGKREYSYLERSLFGVNFRLDKDIEEKTTIDIKGDAITVVGINKDGSWWNKFADMGERGIMILNHADQYVFATKKKAPVVGYEQFCH